MVALGAGHNHLMVKICLTNLIQDQAMTEMVVQQEEQRIQRTWPSLYCQVEVNLLLMPKRRAARTWRSQWVLGLVRRARSGTWDASCRMEAFQATWLMTQTCRTSLKQASPSISVIFASSAIGTLSNGEVLLAIIAVNAIDPYASNVQITSVNWLKLIPHYIVCVIFAIPNSLISNWNKISWLF